jgi:hypothetical protein
MPEAKREKVEALIRDIAEHAHLNREDEEFFAESRGMAMGLARAALAFGYEQDWRELQDLIDELFSL